MLEFKQKGVFKILKEWFDKVFKNSSTETKPSTRIGGSVSLIGINNIQECDILNNCIDRIANEISKLEVKSVVKGDTIRIVNDDITRLFRTAPNEYQTTSDFLSACEWQRRKNMNCFIYPQYEWIRTINGNLIKRFKAFYVLNPISYDLGMADNNLFEVRFYFADGSNYTLPYSELIVLKWRRGNNLVLGGNELGSSDANSLLPVADALAKTIDGLPKSIEASMQIKGIYSASTVAGADQLNKMRDDFESHLMTSKKGIVATDIAGTFTPVNINYAEVDANTMEYMKSTIRERFGVSPEVLMGNATDEQHEAFYQTCIEDFLVQFEQGFTEYCFTPREKDLGHEVKAYYSRLKKISISKAIELANFGTSTGSMTLNQINEMFGLAPFEGGDRRLQSLNFVNTEIVDQYQTDKAKGGASE